MALAATLGNAEMIARLARAGADVNSRDSVRPGESREPLGKPFRGQVFRGCRTLLGPRSSTARRSPLQHQRRGRMSRERCLLLVLRSMLRTA